MLNITPIVDSTNVTLEWPRPEGRIETYVIRWWPVDNPEDVRTKNVTESNDVAGGLYEESSVQRVLVSDLMPGVQYSFVICTISYNLISEITNLTTRTSEYTILETTSVSWVHFTLISRLIRFSFWMDLSGCYFVDQLAFITSTNTLYNI